jgi:uncharacterized membrane protein
VSIGEEPRVGAGSHGHHGVSARRRVLTSALLGLCVGGPAAVAVPWTLAPLAAWDVAALTYVCWIWLVVWRLDARQTAEHAEREDPTRAAADLILLIAAVVSLVAVGYVLVRASSAHGVSKAVHVAFGVASVVSSWAVLHTVFALRYARMYYTGADGGADFHESARPAYSDFAYLAFTVGMTFQVSDTELNSREFRATVLRHSLLSYLFGTVIVALTINIVAGLIH